MNNKHKIDYPERPQLFQKVRVQMGLQVYESATYIGGDQYKVEYSKGDFRVFGPEAVLAWGDSKDNSK